MQDENKPDPNGSDALFRAALRESLSAWAICPADQQMTAMAAHYARMVDVNRTMNLTRITKPNAAAVKHFADSLSIVAWLGDRAGAITHVLDVGTGAGFPAVPLAVMNESWHVSAIDSTRKKTDFVQTTCREIGVKNVTVEHARSEEWRPATRFDLVVVRAVSALDRCIEWTGRHVAEGGHLVCFVTPDQPLPEPKKLRKQLDSRGLHESERFDYELSLEGAPLPRSLLVYQR